MSQLSSGALQTMAIALIAVTGLAAANPMASFVDCSDSFWQVACSADAEPAPVDGPGEPAPVDLPGEPVRIDNDHSCVEIDGGFIVCHT